MIRRDHTATVTSLGQGMEKRLFVNGVGITHLTPITKFMAHLPLGFLTKRPRSALVVCFGMGTTYRSLLSWDIHVVGVELVPSVKDAFTYYYDDASEVLRDPNGQIVIDDGRRFLKRTKKNFDVITIDPPPPIEAAGSSLLYTEEFYESVKQHLTPNGVLQQWFPGNNGETLHAVARSLVNKFPYLRVFPSIEGWGYHFLASMQPLAAATSEQIVERMPMKAQKDLLEWHTSKDLRGYFDQLLSQEIPIARLLSSDTAIRIVDDRPLNEYFLLRRLLTDTD
jgi:spermidine synthase